MKNFFQFVIIFVFAFVAWFIMFNITLFTTILIVKFYFPTFILNFILK